MAATLVDTSAEQRDIDRAENPRPLIIAGLLGIVGLVLAVAAWMMLAPVSSAVMAPAVVKVDMNRKTVQHQEGGLVAEILVRDGAKVTEGEPLIVLKDVRVDASNELVRTQLDAEVAKMARLAAEQSWARRIDFPGELTSRKDDPRVAELLSRETTVFKARRAAYDSQVGLIRMQIKETEDEVRARDRQLEADAASIRVQREELTANQALLEQGYVTKTRLLTLERSVTDLEARRGENEAELSRAKQKITDLQLRAENLRSTFMQEAAAELRATTAQVFDLRERLRPTQDAEERQRILAPIAGEVVGLRVTTVGAVIAPREPILDIVPENADLIIEARVRPEDITHLEVGAPADVRLTGFRRRLTPVVDGTVIYVSADRLEEKTTNGQSTAHYLAHIRVTPEALKKAGGLALQAGMPAEIFIKTESRTALEYLVDPITAFLQRSLREH